MSSLLIAQTANTLAEINQQIPAPSLSSGQPPEFFFSLQSLGFAVRTLSLGTLCITPVTLEQPASPYLFLCLWAGKHCLRIDVVRQVLWAWPDSRGG